MAATIPTALKAADIARFAQRAGQLEKAKPVVAYWCNYWIVNQILSKGLHNSNDESMTYTMHLMDKLEQSKSDHQDNDAIVDDLAGQAYVENFGLETLSRAENAMKLNKATRQTADTFQASATFLELCHIWGPLDPEVASKIKYAKYHAVRIARAIKVGDDPNLSNPTPVQSPAPAEPSVELDDPDFYSLHGSREHEPARSSAHQPSVEEAPDDYNGFEPNRAENYLANESLRLPRAPSTSQEPKQDTSGRYGAPSPQEVDNYYNDYKYNERAPSIDKNKNTSDEGGYFPTIPDPETIDHPSTLPEIPPNNPGFLLAADDPFSPMDTSPPIPPSFPHAPEPYRTTSPQSFPPPTTNQPPPPYNPSAPYPSYPSQPPHAPRTTTRPIQPTPPQHPQPRPGQGPPPPPFAPASRTPHPPPAATTYATDEEAILKAQKHARWAISALNFEDVKTAVKELGEALELLGAR